MRFTLLTPCGSRPCQRTRGAPRPRVAEASGVAVPAPLPRLATAECAPTPFYPTRHTSHVSAAGWRPRGTGILHPRRVATGALITAPLRRRRSSASAEHCRRVPSSQHRRGIHPATVSTAAAAESPTATPVTATPTAVSTAATPPPWAKTGHAGQGNRQERAQGDDREWMTHRALLGQNLGWSENTLLDSRHLTPRREHVPRRTPYHPTIRSQSKGCAKEPSNWISRRLADGSKVNWPWPAYGSRYYPLQETGSLACTPAARYTGPMENKRPEAKGRGSQIEPAQPLRWDAP